MVSDDKVIQEACNRVIQQNPKLVQDIKTKKKSKYLNKLISLVKDNTKEKIDMKKVTETLQKLIQEK